MNGKENICEKTITFSTVSDKDEEAKKILLQVYQALSEKGYRPIDQIVGYLLSEDPTYITNHKNARALIQRIDRDELLNNLIESYLGLKR